MSKLPLLLTAMIVVLTGDALAQARPERQPIDRQEPRDWPLPIQDGPPAGTQLICNLPAQGGGQFGVFVLQFMKDGSVKEVVCKGNRPGTGNPRTIEERGIRKPDASYLYRESTIVVRKWVDPNNPDDPCYEYVIDGEMRNFCW